MNGLHDAAPDPGRAPFASGHSRQGRQTATLDIVGEVQDAVTGHNIVIVGMRQNAFPRRARKALDAARIPYLYLEYGSYLSQWRRRTALKPWTGWPTLPMVFVNGVLVGGAHELERLIVSGELTRLLTKQAKNSS